MHPSPNYSALRHNGFSDRPPRKTRPGRIALAEHLELASVLAVAEFLLYTLDGRPVGKDLADLAVKIDRDVHRLRCGLETLMYRQHGADPQCNGTVYRPNVKRLTRLAQNLRRIDQLTSPEPSQT